MLGLAPYGINSNWRRNVSSPRPFASPVLSDQDVRWITDLLRLPEKAFTGNNNDDPRLEALKSQKAMDVEACPGSGKTTLLVAKLGTLSRGWKDATRGICVLSHTNVARREIEAGLGSTAEGQRIMAYPHFVGTIHSFINEFLSLPWLRSLGYEIRAIDDEACLAWRWKQLPYKTRLALEKSGKDENCLRVKAVDFSVGKIPWGRGFLQTDGETYKAIQSVCRSTSGEGLFCYDEMFMWANNLLDHCPEAVAALRQRFPLLFIDEVQDNSEMQSALLHRIFIDSPAPVIRQRFGDINQAIFQYTGQEGAATDVFPAQAATWPIPNSHRFGQQIADFADSLAVIPQGLVGNGPSRRIIQTDTQGKHTIFLFDDATIPYVMNSYAGYLVELFSEQELAGGIFTAVGAVHRPGEQDNNRPRHVGHYWPQYDYQLTSSQPKPSTFFQYVSVARKQSAESGEAHQGIQLVADGILRMSRILSPINTPSNRRRTHLQVLELLGEEAELKLAYLGFQKRVAICNDMPNKRDWEQSWVPVLQSIASVVSKEPDAEPLASFLEYSSESDADGIARSAQDNIFRHPGDTQKVKVRVGSIHSVKGETHTATLVLDTFYYKHNLSALKSWLLGQKSGGSGESAQSITRLKLHYVAMTRPSHLLCLATKDATFSAAELAILQERGWRLARVTRSGTEWL
jgi:DNA helicase-2/ATP-dependent DNA helicase PcrA